MYFKKFIIPVCFTYHGKFTIKARSKKDAIKIADECCRKNLSGISVSKDARDLVKWDFPWIPQKEIMVNDIQEAKVV